MTVPLFDAQREFTAQAADLEDAALRVLRSGRYISGTEVAALEADCASYIGVRHALGCASGTDALELALRSLGIGPGDSVLTSPFTFFATVSAVLAVGARPVFCDIDPVTFNLDPTSARAVLEGRDPALQRLGVDPATIRAMIPVHLYGLPADVDAVGELAADHGIKVIEDAAQAIGASVRGTHVGTFGNVGCFSFFPTKNLGAFGDGGLVITNDDDVADRIRLLRAHGSRERYFHEIAGTNSRLDEIQAAMLSVRLRGLDAAIEARTVHADAYDELLADAGVTLPDRGADRRHAFHLYVIRSDDRDALREHLASQGIGTAVYYPVPAHLQAALGDTGYAAGDFPQAERASHEVLALPLFPTLTRAEIEDVAAAVRANARVG